MRMGAAGGWLVSLVLGVGGGLAIGPAMFDIPHMAFGGAHAFDREAVAVSDGFGAAWVEDPLLERRAVHPNVRLSAPLAMGLGPDASVAFSSHGIRAQLSGAARMLISDQSDELRLERGQLLLQRTTPARVEIEDFEAAVSGASFGVWVESERWQVAALDGPATVTLGAAEVVVVPGQQRGFTKAGPEPKTFGLAERLEVELESTRRQRGKTMLSLRAAPGALARASIGEVSAEARVGADGKIELAVPALRGDVQLLLHREQLLAGSRVFRSWVDRLCRAVSRSLIFGMTVQREEPGWRHGCPGLPQAALSCT